MTNALSHVGRDSNDVLNGLPGPTKLGNNLSVGLGGQGSVRPGVNRDLVAGGVLELEHIRARDDAGTDDEEGGLELLNLEVVEDERSVGRGSVIEGETEGVLGRAGLKSER